MRVVAFRQRPAQLDDHVEEQVAEVQITGMRSSSHGRRESGAASALVSDRGVLGASAAMAAARRRRRRRDRRPVGLAAFEGALLSGEAGGAAPGAFLGRRYL